MLAVERKGFYIWFEYQFFEGCAMARAVSRQPLTAESRVRARVNPCEICGGQSGTGTGFSSNFSVFLLRTRYTRVVNHLVQAKVLRQSIPSSQNSSIKRPLYQVA
jgi:hypothetical protein